MEEIEAKKFIKSIKKDIGSSRSIVEELFYKIALAYCYEKNNKNMDAKELFEEVMAKIIQYKSYDEFLVGHFMSMSKELGYADTMGVKVAEARYENDPSNQENALQLFDTYVSINDFMKMNATSKKIETTFGLNKYAIHSIQSLYMLSQTEGAFPNTIDLAYMFCKIHIDKFPKDDKIPAVDGQLYLKILKKKNMSTEALEFIQNHPETFSSDLDKSRECVSILQFEIDSLKQQGKLEETREPQCKLLAEVRDVVKKNYVNPAEFNCIYDLYEILVNTLVELVQESIKDQELEKLYQDSRDSEAKESDLFELSSDGKTYNDESVKNLFRSLIFYQDFELDTNKSTEAHNLRKASILAQLYLMHRL